MRRRTALRASGYTDFPPKVREHVRTHQPPCVGPLAGMLTYCSGGSQMDHVRASHGMGMKSPSVATNAARLCNSHHEMKTLDGRIWRPRLLDVIARLHGECADCQRESIELTGRPLSEGVA